MSRPDTEKCRDCRLGPPDWEYVCGECAAAFRMPAASGPTEEKRRTCPRCGSPKIRRVDIVKSDACAPGG